VWKAFDKSKLMIHNGNPAALLLSKDVLPSFGLTENRAALLLENIPMYPPPVRGSCRQTPPTKAYVGNGAEIYRKLCTGFLERIVNKAFVHPAGAMLKNSIEDPKQFHRKFIRSDVQEVLLPTHFRHKLC